MNFVPEQSSLVHFYYVFPPPPPVHRTELHFNHFAENNTFGIMPQSKVELLHKLAKYTSH